MSFRRNEADSLILSGEVFYYHDSQNRLESTTHYLEGVALDSTQYQYDTIGNIVFKEIYNGTTGELLHMRHVYKYLPNRSPDVITKQEYLFDVDLPLDEFVEEYYNYQAGGDPESINNFLVLESGIRIFGFGYDRVHNQEIDNSKVRYPEELRQHREWNNMIESEVGTNEQIIEGIYFSDYRYDFFYSPINISASSELHSDLEIEFYPNPAEELMTFHAPSILDEVYLAVYNLQGRKVYAQKLKHKEEFDISVLDSGIYLYLANTSEGSKAGRFVKI